MWDDDDYDDDEKRRDRKGRRRVEKLVRRHEREGTVQLGMELARDLRRERKFEKNEAKMCCDHNDCTTGGEEKVEEYYEYEFDADERVRENADESDVFHARHDGKLEQILMKDEFVATEIVRVAQRVARVSHDQFGRVHAWGGNEYGQCATEEEVEEDKENTRNGAKGKTRRRRRRQRRVGHETREQIYRRDYGFVGLEGQTLIKAKRVAAGMSSFAVTVEGDVYSSCQSVALDRIPTIQKWKI